MTNLGLYVHVPFCEEKCNYCDFYSFKTDEQTKDLYVKKVQEELMRWGARVVRPIDSLYLGGGTPSLLGGERIAAIIEAAKSAFSVCDAEITLECNPADDLSETLKTAAAAGVNRVSLGVQTANEQTLAILGRRHRNADVIKTVADIRAAGIDNVSMDLMIGLPDSGVQDVCASLEFILSQNPSHISVYILKIEEGTPFYKASLNLPDEDEICGQYLKAAGLLKAAGFNHYEISNFARKGAQSRHNLKYWNCEEYIGIGPSAHSYLGGRRFYYERSLQRFLAGAPVVPDGAGGSSDEYIMLRLRLGEGIIIKEYEKRFGSFNPRLLETAKKLSRAGYVKLTDEGFSLTEQGFLVSNSIIGEFI